MKKLIPILLVIVAAGVGVGVYSWRKQGPEPQATTQQLTRGDIVDAVGATGTLEAVETVDVGTQVSGIVQALYADFNDIVRKGQVIARLDPSLIQTQIEQQSANVARAEADLERLRVTLADAKQKLDRAQQMSQRNLIPRTELETAEVNVRSAEAQIRSSQAGLTQARAQLNATRVNLQHTVIEAPIDGIVISRNVDQGQTVASSMNAPTLYVIAADLTKMQVVANIDEADVGRMRPGQHVTFRVDAYPQDTFTGTVQQVRLQPAVVQNVVTYSTVIEVPNPELKLKPGMTANVSIEIARKSNVLRAPAAALRFRPTNDMFAALNQPVPPELQRGGRGGFGERPSTSSGQAPSTGSGQAAQQQQPSAQPQRGQSPEATQRQPRADSPESRGGGDSAGAPRGDANRGERRRGDGSGGGFGGGRGGFDPNMTPEERQRRREEMLKNMTPEQRAEFEERMRRRAEGGGRGGGFGNRDGNAGAPRANQNAGSPNRNRQSAAGARNPLQSGATTIDALFPPVPVVERPGMLWLFISKQLKPVRVRTGISDGQWTEIINEDEGLQAGTDVVVNLVTGLEQRTTPGQGGGQNPLMGPQRGGPGGRGPGGPGGGGGGRGR